MVIITLPAFNEEAALPRLLNEIRAAMAENQLEYRVLVVNDGSIDGTGKVVAEMSAEMPLTSVDHEENRGLGESIRTGLMRSLDDAADRDIIVTMDADNTHAPGLIARMVNGIREGNDVIVASRYRPTARIKGVPAYRRFLSLAANTMFRILFPMRNVRDYTSGYRAYRAGMLKQAFDTYGEDFVAQSGFSCMVDIMLKLRRLDAIVSEVPLILRYDRKIDVSKMLVMRTIGETLRLMAVRRLGRG
jgi:dolichol-phosphate mannosyltransferase